MTQAWYKDGLHFECARCGHCCTGVPGHVRVTLEEVRVLARATGLEEHQFLDMYTRRLSSGGFVLREESNHNCIFWDAHGGCSVYAQRPQQCRTWPFWRGVIASRAHWAKAGEGCPGMGAGRFHSAAEIRTQAENDGTSGTIPDLS